MIESVVAGVALALLGWVAAVARGRYDRAAVCRWLLQNTKDRPGESHVPTVAIAKGTRRSEDRVRAACLRDPRVFRTEVQGTELWSIWRAEEQLSYQMFVLGGDDPPLPPIGRPALASEWRDMEARFEKISGEVDGARSVYTESGEVRWSLYPRTRMSRVGMMAVGFEDVPDGSPRRLQRFEAEARVAADLWLRHARKADPRDPVDVWLDVVAGNVDSGSHMSGDGIDDRGHHTTQHYENLVDASKVACITFAAQVETR